MKSLRLLAFSLGVLGLAQQEKAWACASCGSGSDDPLVLWPSEKLKTYVGWSTSGQYEVVGPKGERGRDAGPTSRDTLTFAAGRALLTDVFATLTLPVQQNRSAAGSLRSLGDPMLALRWSWLMPDFTEPLRPQVQLMMSHKFAHARTLQESSRLDLLDAFSTGIAESKVGWDLFWGMSTLKGGLAVAALFPEERRLAGAEVFPGNALRVTGTLGVALDSRSKMLVGSVHEMREQRRDNGVRIDNSQVRATGFFLTADWGYSETQMLRFSVTDRGHWGYNRNMIASRAASVAWLARWE